jgi:hypothetical protein
VFEQYQRFHIVPDIIIGFSRSANIKSKYNSIILFSGKPPLKIILFFYDKNAKKC